MNEIHIEPALQPVRTTAADGSLDRVRERVTAGHAAAREVFRTVAEAALRVTAGEAGATIALHEAIGALYTRQMDQLAMEETELVPLLRSIDAWGPQRAAELIEELRQQRTVLDALVDECNCGTKDDLELADDALWLVRSLAKRVAAEDYGLAGLRDDGGDDAPFSG